MPRSHRTGKTYAAGSQATFDGYPRLCAAGHACKHGGRIVMSGPYPLWFEHVAGGEDRSWHFACRPRVAP